MKLKILVVLVSILGTQFSTFAVAEQYPVRGTAKYQVQEKHGQPLDRVGPVGTPPITRWIYADFSVVFEYDLVIHSYARKPDLENRPVSSISERPDPSTGDTLYMPD